jgi:hypothetical protein
MIKIKEICSEKDTRVPPLSQKEHQHIKQPIKTLPTCAKRQEGGGDTGIAARKYPQYKETSNSKKKILQRYRIATAQEQKSHQRNSIQMQRADLTNGLNMRKTAAHLF